MFIALLVVATILSLIGIVLFLVDAFRVHWGWGLASLCIPFASVVCLVRHWSATKRGFFVYLFAIPFSVGAVLAMPKPAVAKSGAPQRTAPSFFFSAMERARAATAQVTHSRHEETPLPKPAPAAAPIRAVAPAAPAVTQTLPQRFAANRAAFKALESEFATLAAKRKVLPKKDPKVLAAYNLEAKTYTEKLAAARVEQENLIALSRGVAAK